MAETVLLDGFGRSITTLRLSVTDLCNERCIYCMPKGGVMKRAHGDMLSIEELEQIGEAAVRCGIRTIRLTGGEPLVRRGIETLVHNLGGLCTLCMTTNGVLLPPVAKDFRRMGLKRVNLSIDSLREERYAQITRQGTLQAALDGLESALSAGFERVKVNVVLMGGVNDDEIGDFIALTKQMPIDVRFLELMPMGECQSWPRERFVSASEVLKRFPALVPIGTQGVSVRYQMPGYKGAVGLISPMSHSFCDVCSRIRVTPDGMLKPCLHSGEEISLWGLTGDALCAAIRQGVLRKPKAHALLNQGSHAGRDMNEIGG